MVSKKPSEDQSTKYSTSLDDFEIINKIGKGSFGTVYKVRRKADGCIYVMKQINSSLLNPKVRDTALNEVQILASLRHSFIVKYYDSFLDHSNLNIIMEYCEGGDLENFMKKQAGKPLPEARIWKLLIQILTGLYYIHKKNIIHRDIKSLNIFVTKEGDVRMGDLGLAKMLDYAGKMAHASVGTPYYLSPEICEDKPYNEKTDIWSLGVILYELCTYKHPFEATSHGILSMKIVKGVYKPIPDTYSKELASIIDDCLCKDQSARSSAKDLLTKPYVVNKAKALNIDIEKLTGIILSNTEATTKNQEVRASISKELIPKGQEDSKGENSNSEKVQRSFFTNQKPMMTPIPITNMGFKTQYKKFLDNEKNSKEQNKEASSNNLYKLYFDAPLTNGNAVGQDRNSAMNVHKKIDNILCPRKPILDNKMLIERGKNFPGSTNLTPRGKLPAEDGGNTKPRSEILEVDSRTSINLGNRTSIPRPRGKSEAFGVLKVLPKSNNYLMPTQDIINRKGVNVSIELDRSISKNAENLSTATGDHSKLNNTRDLDIDASPRSIQLRQIIQQQKNDCIQLLGEKVFYETIGFFRKKLNSQKETNTQDQEDINNFINSNLSMKQNTDKAIRMIYKLLQNEIELSKNQKL